MTRQAVSCEQSRKERQREREDGKGPLPLSHLSTSPSYNFAALKPSVWISNLVIASLRTIANCSRSPGPGKALFSFFFFLVPQVWPSYCWRSSFGSRAVSPCLEKSAFNGRNVSQEDVLVRNRQRCNNLAAQASESVARGALYCLSPLQE